MKELTVKEAKKLRRAIVRVLSCMPYRVRVVPDDKTSASST
jgi:hypothetical protein